MYKHLNVPSPRVQKIYNAHTVSILASVATLTELHASPSIAAASDNQTEIVQDPLRIYGNDSYTAYFRRSKEIDAPRARYPGFNPMRTVLKAGSIRREGALPLPSDIMYERDVPVTMRDGTVIYTDVFRPVRNTTAPAIVSWSPYGKEIGSQWLNNSGKRLFPLSSVSELQKFEGADPTYWVAKGYAVLNPDARGDFSSNGNITYWGRQLAEDGYDFVKWAAAESWWKGRSGFPSPHLAAIVPWEGFTDVYRDVDERGGIPAPGFSEAILTTFAGNNLVEGQPRMILSEPLITPYWTDKIAMLEKITVPAYIVASYTNTLHTHGSFEGFRNIRSESKWLRVHNTSEWPDYYTAANVADLNLFFDRYLMKNNTWEQTPTARMSVLDPGGEDTIDIAETEWPPARLEPTTLYLQANESLSLSSVNSSTTVAYLVTGSGVYFNYTVPADMEMIGYMKVRLWLEAVRSDDMDISVTMQKLSASGEPFVNTAGGSSTISASNIQRVSLHHLDANLSTAYEPYQTFDRVELLSAGEIVPVEIGLWPMAMRFRAGETLSILIAPMGITSADEDLPPETTFRSVQVLCETKLVFLI